MASWTGGRHVQNRMQFEMGKDFLPKTQKATVVLTTLNLKLLSLKRHITFKGVKRQATRVDVWIYINKGLISRIHKESLLNKKNPDNPIGIWAQGWKKNITKGRYPNGHKNLIKNWRKCKLNPQWDPTAQLTKWLKRKTISSMVRMGRNSNSNVLLEELTGIHIYERMNALWSSTGYANMFDFCTFLNICYTLKA